MNLRTGSVVGMTVIGTCIALAIGAFVGVWTGMFPANADAKPGALETWAAKTSRHATIDREVQALHGPAAPTDSMMVEGVRLYRAQCVVCHGAADGKPSSIAQGLYQDPPQFGKHDVADDPIEETYWKITHGIRLTGMPAFTKTLTTDQRWAIAAFLRHEDSLPPLAAAAWHAIPSVADTATVVTARPK